jgi:hypothetical protein
MLLCVAFWLAACCMCCHAVPFVMLAKHALLPAFAMCLLQVRNQLAVVKSSEYTLIKSRFDELYERQQKVLSTVGGTVWREKLEEAVSAADSASAAVKADFLAGDMLLEDFVRRHVELRTKHHVLDLKRQAAEQLLRPPPVGNNPAAGLEVNMLL